MMRMLAVLTIGLVLGSALIAGDRDATKGKTTVEGVALSVQKKLDQKNYPFSAPMTMLQIKVDSPGKQFMGVDAASTVSEMKDDKGTSLLATGLFKTSFQTSPQIAVNRESLVVSLSTMAAPAKGATKVHLKGSLVLLTGLEEKTTDEKEVTIKQNAETKLGDFTLRVTMEKGFGTQGASFSIASKKPNLKSVNVKDTDGKTVELFGFGSYGFGTNWTSNFAMKKVVDKPKISITYFSKEEKVTVPVDVELGLGL
jgi:hypothetical protein